MKKVFFTWTIFMCCIVFGDTAFSATRKSSRLSKTRSASVKNFSGTLNRSTFTGAVNSSYKINDNNEMVCGVAPAVTNKVAYRLCALAMADALKTYCQNYSCQSKLKVGLSFDFGLSALSEVYADVNGVKCSGTKLNTFCLPFQEELLSGLWDLYSESNVRNRKNCNMAKAKYSVAQDCFQYIQSEKNQSVGGVFDSSKISDLDKGIDAKCGRDAILKKYNLIAIDDLTDTDLNTYLGMAENKGGVVSYSSSGFQGKKKLSSTVASLFANVGDNTWNISGQIGKLADLKLDMKSNTYPRELVVIANTFITDGENSCGKDFASTMEDTSFKLVDKRSALERAIAEKGLLKGAYDMIANDEWKEKGIVGKIKESVDKNKEKKVCKNVYPDAKKDMAKLNSCSGDVDAVTTMIKGVLQNVSSAVSVAKSNDCDTKEIISVLEKILMYDRIGGGDIAKPTADNLETIIKQLNDVKKFNCPNTGFSKDLSYEFSFDAKNGDVIGEILGSLKKSSENLDSMYNGFKGENFENYDKINEVIKPVLEIK